MNSDLSLQGKHIRLEPLGRQHVDGLIAAAAADPSLYRWSPVPQGKDEAAAYVDTALLAKCGHCRSIRHRSHAG
jgi:hypothetical protein